MAYVTIADLSDRLGATLYARLTDRVNGTTPDTAVAQQIVAEAEAEADGYLARRFATPLDLGAWPQVAPLLRARVLDLAEHGAWKSSPFVSDPPSRLRALRDAAIRWLEDVARGSLELPGGAGLASSTARDPTVRFVAPSRPLSSRELDES